MTTPYWGNTISMYDINAQIGNGTNQIDMGWVRANTKDGIADLNSAHDRAWYQKNNAGNCNNGNCNCGNCNCGEFNCYNCYAYNCVNCVNCDGRAWLQPNCNCACTYNCYVGSFSYNCNCACACDCGGGTCFPAGAMVLMWDGTWRAIETIAAGEFVMGADGTKAEVIRLHIDKLAQREMFRFADDPKHEWSDEHLHWTRKDGKQWWWSVSPDQWRWEEATGIVGGLKDSQTIRYGSGYEFAHLDGFVKRTHEKVSRPRETPVYLPITAGIPIIVNGYVVAASADEHSYDYSSFEWNKDNIKL